MRHDENTLRKFSKKPIKPNKIYTSLWFAALGSILLICIFANVSFGLGESDLSPLAPISLLLFAAFYFSVYTAAIGMAMVGILLYILFGNTEPGDSTRVLFSIAQAFMAIELGKHVDRRLLRFIVPTALCLIIIGMVLQRTGIDLSFLLSRGEEVAGRGAPGFFSEPSLTAIASCGLYFIGTCVYDDDNRIRRIVLVLTIVALILTATASSLVFMVIVISSLFNLSVWRMLLLSAVVILGFPYLISFSPRLQAMFEIGLLNDASFLARVTPFLYAAEGIFMEGWQIDALVTRNATGEVRNALVGFGAIFFHFNFWGLLGIVLFLVKYLTPSAGFARNAAMLSMMFFSPISFPMVWLLTGVNYQHMTKTKEAK